MIDEQFMKDSYYALKKQFAVLVPENIADEMATMAMEVLCINLSLSVIRDTNKLNSMWKDTLKKIKQE